MKKLVTTMVAGTVASVIATMVNNQRKKTKKGSNFSNTADTNYDRSEFTHKGDDSHFFV
jgi:hypothetical protein